MVLKFPSYLLLCLLMWGDVSAKVFTFLVPDSPRVAIYGEGSVSVGGNVWPSESCSTSEFTCIDFKFAKVLIPKGKKPPAEWSHSGVKYCRLQTAKSDGLGQYFQIYTKNDMGPCDYLDDVRRVNLLYSCEFGLRYVEVVEKDGIGLRLIALDRRSFGARNC